MARSGLAWGESQLKKKIKLNNRTTEPYLVYGDQIGKTKKVQKNLYICYINNVYNLFKQKIST